MNYTLSPIGKIHSCFTEKFGVPRQPGLASAAQAVVEVYPEYAREEAFRGLEGFSHIWLIFVFNQSVSDQWRPTVRPPRLGGNQRVGVFSTRSPYRPNSLGMSVVTLDGVNTSDNKVALHISNHDLVDGTPIVDIKPYIRYADSVVDATGGFAPQAPQKQLKVSFTGGAHKQCTEFSGQYPNLAILITQVLALDPRPAYSKDNLSDKTYGIQLFDINVCWSVTDQGMVVTNLHRVD